MHYFWLILAIVFEAGWAISMKASPELAVRWTTGRTLVLYLLSLVFLTLAVRRMDVGVAYAIWAGLGAVIIAAVGAMRFGEQWSPLKIGAMALIVLGVVGLHLADRGQHAS